MRILFHAPGLVAFRPASNLPHLLGVQPSVVNSMCALLPSHKLTGNRGNIIHAEAPAKTFAKSATGSAYANISVLKGSLGTRYPDAVAANFDLVVISMANFIRPDFSGRHLVDALRTLSDRVPFIVLGCGLQGTHRLSDLDPNTRDLLDVFNKHALIFGVRGHKTASWLHENGFTNAKVLGCPSLYAYPESILAIDGANARAKGNAADVMTAGHLTMRAGRIVPRGIELLKAFSNIKASYVLQDEFLTYDELLNQPGLYLEGSSQVEAKAVNEWLSEKVNQKAAFERYYYFSEASAWRQASLRHDVFIGDRFHGGVAALQASQPAIFLTHDNRVSELTEYFGLPNLTTEEFARRGLADTLEEYLSDEILDRMKATYRKRYTEYFETMAQHGLIPEISRNNAQPPSGTGISASPIRRQNVVLVSSKAPDDARIIRQGHYLLRMIAPKGARELVVTFEAADTTIDRSNQKRKGFGEDFLARNGYAVLSVLTSSANWFRPPAILDAFARRDVTNFLRRFDKVHGYGSSMGGFGALAFADLLGISNIVALQPISSLAPDLVPWETRFAHGRALDWRGSYRDGAAGITGVASLYALYDPATNDAHHVERVASTAGTRLRRIEIPGAIHAVPRFLQERKLLGPAVLACLRGETEERVSSIISGQMASAARG